MIFYPAYNFFQKMTKTRDRILLIICAVFVIVFPFIRLLLVIYQGNRGNSIVHGKCLSYNIMSGKLNATPFKYGCMNTGDLLLMIFCILSPLCGFVYYQFAKIDNPAEELGREWQKMKKGEGQFENISEAKTLKRFGYSFELTKEIIRNEDQLRLMLDKDFVHNRDVFSSEHTL